MIVLTRRNAQAIKVMNDVRVRVVSFKNPQFGSVDRHYSRRNQRNLTLGFEPAVSEMVVPQSRPLSDAKISASPAILMVDDDPDVCRNMADILRDLGYRVDTAHEGHAALQLVERQAYDAALLDLRMPGMDGLTLGRNVVHKCPLTVVFLITGYPADVLPADAQEAGIRAILAKPVDVAELLTEIEDATAS